MDKLKSSKGITLIALVITIIILLILAGVTLNLVLNGGLIEKSQKAVDTYSEEQAKEKLLLDILEYKMKVISEDKNLDFGTYIGTKCGNVEEVDGKYKVTIYGYEFMLDAVTLEIEGGNQTAVTPDIETIPKITSGNNLNGTKHGTLTGGDYAFNNPVIPAGFETVETTLASWEDENEDGIIDGWNEGLVIQDANGNQFVWVPVHNEDVIENGVTIKAVAYEKWNSASYGNKYNDTNISDGTLPNGVIDETTQITTFGGFYVARYEAGIPETLTTAITTASAEQRNVIAIPVSKKNQVPWTYIDGNNSKINAESMYTSGNVKSGLVTGTQWDTIIKWLQNSGVSVLSNTYESGTRSWANLGNAPVENITEYSPLGTNCGASWISKTTTEPKPITGTSNADYMWLLKTGHTEYTNRKNIYDLAGNLWERTAEIYSSEYVVRSCGFLGKDSQSAAGYRGSYENDYKASFLGFRVALFIQ